jgi:hypothetical protein
LTIRKVAELYKGRKEGKEMNRILDKIKKRIDEIQSDCLDDHYNFKNSHNEGVFEGLSKLESYIESLETDIDVKEWKDAQGKDLPIETS